jgi:hypothetical protein
VSSHGVATVANSGPVLTDAAQGDKPESMKT